jgi:hypothetical protein
LPWLGPSASQERMLFDYRLRDHVVFIAGLCAISMNSMQTRWLKRLTPLDYSRLTQYESLLNLKNGTEFAA